MIIAISKIPVQGLPLERYTKHNNVAVEDMEAALEEELNEYKKELAERFVSGSEDSSKLMEILKEAL
jgi:hypothetical protein